MEVESQTACRDQRNCLEITIPEKQNDKCQTEDTPVPRDQNSMHTNTINQTKQEQINLTEQNTNTSLLAKQEEDKSLIEQDEQDKALTVILEMNTDVEISQEQIVAPDGGWGWFVVFAAFIVNLLTDGTIGTFGFFYPYIEAEYQSKPAVTSLTGSLVPTVFLMSAPFTGFLIHRFDCRRVSVIGGVIGTCGLAAASVSPNIVAFAVFYGVVGGVGIGMNNLCGHLIVNTYFNKKRGIANGIVSSGAGFGVFLLAPLLQYLLESYAWRGTMLIYSGCILQYCICGMLMRPLSPSYSKARVPVVSDLDSQETTSSETDQSEKPLIKQNNAVVVKIDGESKTKPKLFHSQDVCQKPLHLRKYFASMFHMNKENPTSVFRKSLPDLSKSRDANHVYSYQNISSDILEAPHIHRRNKKNAQNKDNTHSHTLNPLDRKDIFYSGSIYNIHEYQKAGSMAEFINDMAEVATVATSSTELDDDFTSLKKRKKINLGKRIRSLASRLIDVSVFKSTVYVPVLLSGVFLQMGQFIPLTFLPNYCYSIGLSASDVTIIISIFGITNIFGRLSAGCLANVECISTLWLCTFGNFMCGVSCALFPLCNSLVTLCIFAASFGYFIGYFCPLQVIIMVEYLGIEKLTSAYGILQLCKGPAALFGPPLAGMVYEMTNDYKIALLVAAVLFILATVIQATIPLINRCSKKT